MNTEQNADNQAPKEMPGASLLSDHESGRVSALSALVDGEIDPPELDGLLLAFAEQTEVRASWHSYQVIGDVLRGSAPAATVRPPQVFWAGIQERLQAAPIAPARPEPVDAVAHVRAPAANDAVFRWKLVAGAASLAAVMAVSWSVLSGAPSGAGGAGTGGAQLALMQPGAEPAPETALNSAPTAVLVRTDRGTVIRDARLEELLAEHRQYGGMSALQMPAGFLRDATYDAAPQR